MATIEALEQRQKAARRTRDAALAGLKNPGGGAIYSPSEEQRRRDAAETAFRAEQSAIDAELKTVLDEQERIIYQTGAADPLTRLDSGELERAAMLHSFVREDFAVLPIERIAELIDAAVENRDRVRTALYVRAGRLALEGRFAAQPDDTDRDMTSKADARRRLQPAIDRAAEIVIDTASRDKALEVIERARALQQAHAAVDFIASTYSRR